MFRKPAATSLTVTAVLMWAFIQFIFRTDAERAAIESYLRSNDQLIEEVGQVREVGLVHLVRVGGPAPSSRYTFRIQGEHGFATVIVGAKRDESAESEIDGFTIELIE